MNFYWINLIVLLGSISETAGQKNLTGEGKAYQSSTYRQYDADRALQPPASTDWATGCSHTEKDSVAWWKIVFNHYFAITKIIIYYRDTFVERVNGFSLYVTNNTLANVPSENPPQGFLCYKDPDTLDNQSFIFDIDCFTVGRSVLFYNTHYDSEFVELCYVEVHGCPLTKYGINCTESCHSKCIDQHCFPGNGSCVYGCSSELCVSKKCNGDATCTEGCIPGQNGRYCDKNYKNIASNRSAFQGPSNIFTASIVDGNRLPESCTHLTESNAWFEVDLGDYSVIKAMYIDFRETGNAGEGNHYIYCSNDTNSKGIVLYEGQRPTHDIDVADKICRYVRFIPPDKALEVCEIEIIGCHSGWYGRNCTQSCPDHCRKQCDPYTGDCTYGCLDGYTGQKCDTKCQDGKYGSYCLRTCSVNCIYFPCDHGTGQCVNGGCKRGWLGYNCTTACSSGKYGINCSEFCNGCINNLCEPMEGLCMVSSQCKSGWKVGPKCNEVCNDYFYGLNCKSICYCIGEPCNKTTGKCSAGCQKGWKEDTCNEECSVGYFGENCNRSCDGCVYNECDRFDGSCVNDTHCKPGWLYDRKCNTQCRHGTYGINCSESCSGCVNDICENVEGFCSIAEKCKPGWVVGPNCNEACGHGAYGFNCEDNCNTCINKTCDSDSGKCVYGCIEGFYGDLCSSQGEEANDKSGVIGGGVSAGLIMFIAAGLIFLFLRRRNRQKDMESRQKQNNKNSDNSPDRTYYTDLQRRNAESQDADYINTCTDTNERQYDGLCSQSALGITQTETYKGVSKQNETNVYEVVSGSNTNSEKCIYQNEV